MGYTAGGSSAVVAGGATLAATGANGTTIGAYVAAALIALGAFMLSKARSRNRKDREATGEI